MKIIIISMLLLVSCGGSGNRFDDEDDASVRFGDSISPEQLKEFDGLPDINSDGTKGVFTSGRDDVRRTYKFERSTSVTTSRLTSDTDALDEEIQSIITADGSWVMLKASKDNSIDLYLKDFSGAQTIQKISDSDGLVETEFVMNDDSTAYAFIRRASSGNGQLYVGLLDSNGLSGDPALISETDYDESKPVFISTGVAGSYSVVTVSRQSSSLVGDLKKRDFGTSLSVSATTTLVSELDLMDSVSIAAHDAGVIFAVLNAVSGESVDAMVPVGDVDTTAEVTVNSFNQKISSSGGSAQSLASFGFDVVSNSHTTSSSGMGIWVVKDAYSCQSDIEYGSSIIVYDPNSESDSYRLRLRVEEDQSTTVQTSICNNKVTQTNDEGEESEKELGWDKNILGAKVAIGSTKSSFQVVYTSLLTGNSEVRMLIYDGTDYSIIEVSKVTE